MPTTIEALIVIALVISPGYICARFMRDVIFLSRDPGDIRFLLPAITCGTLVHILMSWWSVGILCYYRAGEIEDHIREFIGWGVATGFVAPIVIGVGVSLIAKIPLVDKLLEKIGMGYADRLPTAWEYSLRYKRAPYVRVHLKDQVSPIGGIFGKKSFASTEPSRADLFLQEVLILNEEGQFTGERYDNWGTWISHDSILRIE